MEKLYLEEPSLERKNELLEYLQEHVESNSEINGTGGLNKCLKDLSYEDWLEKVKKEKEKDYAEEQGLVPATTYITVRESDNKVIGMLNFRHYLNDSLAKSGGHIGYGIRPSERNKGYAKVQLYLALIEAHKKDLKEVMVDCVESNEASEKTIIALGGRFSEEVSDPKYQEKLHNYWINVEDSLEKYKDEYKEKILVKE